MPGDTSLAKLYREFGGTKWMAVQRESGGDHIKTVVANEVGTLRFRMTEVEREVPEERT